MFSLGRNLTQRVRFSFACFSTSTPARAHINRPLDLDPSLKVLLKDVNISLKNHKFAAQVPARRELNVVSIPAMDEPTTQQDLEEEEYEGRKSPAAEFGSRGFGAVVLPLELQNAIDVLISESDKSQLHSDAKRLFQSEDDIWTSQYSQDYHSRLQASRHGRRDGYAFASVALPAHYSAILAVLQHIKIRLGPDFKITHVTDWSAATGSAIWAALYTFQNPILNELSTQEDLKIRNSTVKTCLAIDKREGLTTIAKRIFHDVELGDVDIFWQKSFQDVDKIGRSKGHDALAISAFMLSSLNTASARRALVQEMWQSGAHTMVLLDHGTAAGFEAILEARETLLNMGRREMDDPEAESWEIRGCHVLAPCPHDAVCPLHHLEDRRSVCAFPQRLQRPSFVRLTKHSGQGHEDIMYSYVVLRRGARPASVDDHKIGRIGEVGRRELEKDALRQEMKELTIHDVASEHNKAPATVDSAPPVRQESVSRVELEKLLRLEAYRWPRLILPPLKRSGHIILDGCTAGGKVLRMTIPKSQGKQPFYDARKSSWGDIFPHDPKNPPQERYKPGKDGKSFKKEIPSYEAISTRIKEERKRTRRYRLRAAEMKLK